MGFDRTNPQLKRETAAKLMACPACGAGPQYACKALRDRTRTMSHPHPERIKEAERWLNSR